jgi:hypothetical protein
MQQFGIRGRFGAAPIPDNRYLYDGYDNDYYPGAAAGCYFDDIYPPGRPRGGRRKRGWRGTFVGEVWGGGGGGGGGGGRGELEELRRDHERLLRDFERQSRELQYYRAIAGDRGGGGGGWGVWGRGVFERM